jgi:hypothetical protein
MAIPMRYRPGVDVDTFEPGDWDYFASAIDDRAGIIVRVPTGGHSYLPMRGKGAGIGRGAEWDFAGDEATGLTLTPSVLHAAGTRHEWHGYITAGQLVPC